MLFTVPPCKHFRVLQQTCGNICTAFTARLERVWVVTGPIFDAAPSGCAVAWKCQRPAIAF